MSKDVSKKIKRRATDSRRGDEDFRPPGIGLENKTQAIATKKQRAGLCRFLAREAERNYGPGAGYIDAREAELLEQQVEELMQPLQAAQIVAGESLPSATDADRNHELWLFRNTLLDGMPTSAEASHVRLSALLAAGGLALGLDLSDSIRSANSWEKCLAHQAAAAHLKAMELLTRMTNATDQEAVPLVNAASRLMKCCQDAYLALFKVRTGGRQTLLVQHQHQQVHVGPGGQAIVSARGVLHEGGDEQK
jgi:hypothetical protein